ncbi:hypothetical protein [Lacicoccus alkaliphilus]|uniref:Uncharacterized protein n=1 Tax=Lacicoccus alkaliphilus DSM 16010 TaxID=1123231 RepID=A0A1M7E9Y7_9BACL|nr:hypothetical protein [Salinicoccus alkaliphilus]SHL88591.1 hypothetical protein SAMN02745189_01153 [Salinicoccus alkaliphilus DSM 16010]
MRIVILIILLLLNAASMIEMTQYFDTGFIQLLSARIILAVISFILALVYLLVGGSAAMKIFALLTVLTAVSHLVFMLYINL